MIITLILQVLVYMISGIFWLLPTVSLPVGVVSAMTNMVQYYNSFLDIFPFAVLPTQIFLWIILPFEIGLLIAKFFLGSRIPAHI